MPNLLEKIGASAADRLPLPPDRLPSQELPRYKKFLKIESHRLKILHRAGGGGREICRARAAIIDVLMLYLLQSIETTLAPAERDSMPPFVLVALGGYGRQELNPCSDIDIMFLHEEEMIARGRTHPGLRVLFDGLLYTLWDSGLKVGHSVRTISNCVELANHDMQSKTSLIEARLILGDEGLFRKFEKAILSRCVNGHEDEYTGQRLAEQAARRAKFGNSPFMQEPNVKNGCGGLRDYQNLLWMAFFKYRTRTLGELRQKELISVSEERRLQAAHDFLLRVRNEMHYHLDRGSDVLARNLQAAIAGNLGYPDRSAGRRVEAFMRDFYTHARHIDLITRTVEQRLALVPQPRLLPSFRRFFRSRRQRARQQLFDGFKFLDGEIHPGTARVFRDKPRRLMRVFLYAQQRGFRLHPDLTQLIRNELSLVNRSFQRDEHVRETFLEILDQRGAVARILRDMHEVGLLGKYLPEFGRLTCLVQHEFYHQYTADEHTLVCLEKLDRIWGATQPPFSNYVALLQSLERPCVLYLALLLHDAGKAYPRGNHCETGGRLALRVARRLHLDGATTHSLRLLIENHLFLAQISQRRDLDDPAVIRSVAGHVQSVENLLMLTLHTIADSMGTSDQLWNSFKDSLLMLLFHQTRKLLEGGADYVRVGKAHRELLMSEVLRALPPHISHEELYAHFANLPPRYFQIHDAGEIINDLVQVHRFMQAQVDAEAEPLAPVIAWHNVPDRGYTQVDVCTWDRAGLFSKITGSLTAAGLNILGAEVMTRADAIALDSYYVNDAQTGFFAKREERERFEQLLKKVLTGRPADLDGLIARQKKRGPRYQSLEGERIAAVVHFDNETSEFRTVIDVEAEDRVGLLYGISQALAEFDLDISVAKISTEKGAAFDSFYVVEGGGQKIIDPGRRRQIERKLREAAVDAVEGR